MEKRSLGYKNKGGYFSRLVSQGLECLLRFVAMFDWNLCALRGF